MSKKKSLVFVVVASIVFAVVTLSTILFTPSSVNASCGNRPGTPDQVKAEPSPGAPTSDINFSWRNTTGKSIEQPNGYFDIYFTDGNGQPVGGNLTGTGPYRGISYGSRSTYTLTGLAPGTRRCFSIRARTEGGRQGCVSRLASAQACATTLLRAPVPPAPNRPSSPSSGSTSQPSRPQSPVIGAELTYGAVSFGDYSRQLRVYGGAFSAGEQVNITVTTRTNGQDPASNTTATTADSLGRINQTIGVQCPPGSSSVFQVRAAGLSSGKVSNSTGASC